MKPTLPIRPDFSDPPLSALQAALTALDKVHSQQGVEHVRSQLEMAIRLRKTTGDLRITSGALHAAKRLLELANPQNPVLIEIQRGLDARP